MRPTITRNGKNVIIRFETALMAQVAAREFLQHTHELGAELLKLDSDEELFAKVRLEALRVYGPTAVVYSEKDDSEDDFEWTPTDEPNYKTSGDTIAIVIYPQGRDVDDWTQVLIVDTKRAALGALRELPDYDVPRVVAAPPAVDEILF